MWYPEVLAKPMWEALFVSQIYDMKNSIKFIKGTYTGNKKCLFCLSLQIINHWFYGLYDCINFYKLRIATFLEFLIY